eukprot:evm.model.scf_4984.1 EVM.evm.TU.scf_4984.1   scf_4984:1952-3574(+)
MVPVDANDAVAGVAAAAGDAASPGAADVAVQVLFLVAAVGLVIVTIGAVYLSVASWFDDRAEKQDQEKLEKRTKYEEEMQPFEGKRKKKEAPKKATDKGFGSS